MSENERTQVLLALVLVLLVVLAIEIYRLNQAIGPIANSGLVQAVARL